MYILKLPSSVCLLFTLKFVYNSISIFFIELSSVQDFGFYSLPRPNMFVDKVNGKARFV